VAPGGSEIVPTWKTQPDGTICKAQASRRQRTPDNGVYVSASDIGDDGNISGLM
jgi:hypothetical protein